jgi:hypothetical protein
VAAVVLGSVTVWGAFEWGRRAGGYDALEADRARRSLASEILRLQTENENLRRELSLMKAAGRVDSEAYGRVSREIDDLHSQIVELNEELAFYRGIMAPGEGQTGLQVQTVQIEPGDGDRVYRVRLVLVQMGRQNRRVSGSVRVAVVGARGTAPVPLQAPDNEAQDLQFAFRYFQILEGEVVLPEGFQPERLDVHLDPAGKGQEDVDLTFPWQTEEA